MSVINKMLQDLEERKSDVGSINADYQPPQKTSLKVWLVIFLMVVIASVIWGALAVIASQNKKVGPEESAIKIAQVEPEQHVKKILVVKNTSQNTSDNPLPLKKKMADKVVPTPTSKVETTPAVEPVMAADLVVVSDELTNEDDLQAPEAIEKEAAVSQLTPEIPSTFSMNGSDKTEEVVDLKQKIADHLAAGNNEQAKLMLSQLVRNEPNNIKARKKLASMHFSQGNYTQAKLLLIEDIELFPHRSDFRMMLARIFMLQKDAKQAMQWLNEFDSEPNNEEFLAFRAALAQQLKLVDMARADYSALVRINSSNAKWWLGLAVIEDQAGERQKALAAYQSAQQHNQLDTAVTEFIQQRILILAESE